MVVHGEVVSALECVGYAVTLTAFAWYRLHVRSTRTGILNWLRFTYDFEIGLLT